MYSITLRQLHYLSVIAQEKHFGRAALRCHVTQSALSQQIKLLEQRCRTPLFDRTGKEVRLTQFGEAFLVQTNKLLAAADDLERYANKSAGQPTNALRLGIIPTVAPYILPALLPKFRDEFSDLNLSITESKTEALMQSLVEGELDVILIADEPVAGAYTSFNLFEDKFILAAPNASKLTSPVDLETVPRTEFLLLEEGHYLRDQMVDACALKPEMRSRTFSATSLTTILELVSNGFGVTLLPAISLRSEARLANIKLLELKSPGASRTLRLVWRNSTPFKDLFEKIGQIIQCIGQS